MTIPTPDLSAVKSVAVANGMSDKFNRSRTGITAFNNSFEQTSLPGVSAKATASALQNLKLRFPTVKILTVPTVPAKTMMGTSTYTEINVEKFRADALSAARPLNVDAIWIIYPATLAGARGESFTGLVQVQNAVPGSKYESVLCVAKAELINVRTGAVIVKSSAQVSGADLPFIEWQEKLGDYSPSARNAISSAAFQAAKNHMATLQKFAGITATP